MWSAETVKSRSWHFVCLLVDYNEVGFFGWSIFCSGLGDSLFWSGLVDLSLSQILRKVCDSYFLGQFLVCAYSVYQYGQILAICTIPSGSTSYPVIHWCRCFWFYVKKVNISRYCALKFHKYSALEEIL